MLQRHVQFDQVGYAAATAVGDCAVTFIGRFRSRGGFRWHQIVPRISLHVVHGGEGLFHVDGRSWRGRRGDVMAFLPGMSIRYHDEPGRPWRYDWLVFDGQGVVAALAAAGLDRRHPGATAGDYRALAAWCTRLAEAYAEGGHGPCFPAAAAWGVLDAVAPQGGVREPAQLAEACRAAIEERYSTELSIAGLARELGCSRATLFRAFKHRYGRSPKTHLDECRIARAGELLESTDLPVAEVARLSGYAKADYFAAAFRKATGRSPSPMRCVRPSGGRS